MSASGVKAEMDELIHLLLVVVVIVIVVVVFVVIPYFFIFSRSLPS